MKFASKSSANALEMYIDGAYRWITSIGETSCMHSTKKLPHNTKITFEMRKNTFEVF